MDCLIRAARSDEAEGFSLLVARSMPDPWTLDQLREAIASPFGRCILCEMPEAGAVGFVIARRIADFLEIDLVGVAPEWRRRGIAETLLRHLVDQEQGAGMVEARLELAASNHAARALYEKQGFVVVGRRARYYPDGADALLLSLHLKRD